MKNNNRLYNLLAAGSLTVLLALTFFLFRGNGFGTAVGAADTWSGTTPAVVTSDQVAEPSLTTGQAATQADAAQAPALTTLQAQNAKLTQMLQVMQEREKQYQTQLETANQALQAQAAPLHEGYERHAHEAGEHEGSAWFGEHGDDD